MSKPDSSAIDELLAFLPCETPAAWLDEAVQQLPLLLMDHANCEKKAASNAMTLMYRYVDRSDLLIKMSQLAREELLHFEQVVSLMRERDIEYERIGPSRYAGALREGMRTDRHGALIDSLIIGAIVEARSCERFNALAPRLDEKLARYYRSLLRSEARHFQDYLSLARQYALPDEDIDARVAFYLEREKQLIESPDDCFRFHSGVPVTH